MRRQKIRRTLLLIALMLFPVTWYYLSPVVPIEAGVLGIVNGSIVVFVVLFVAAMFLGRLFCSFLCPGGGIQEVAANINDKPPKHGIKKTIKYIIWAIWLASIVVIYVLNGSSLKFDFFAGTEQGFALMVHPMLYVIYYSVVAIAVLATLLGGKRAFCHHICWMAPFMIIGDKLGRALRIPGPRVTANSESCISCHRCSKECPMSIDPESYVQAGKVEDAECIACAACVDVCPKKTLSIGIAKRG